VGSAETIVDRGLPSQMPCVYQRSAVSGIPYVIFEVIAALKVSSSLSVQQWSPEASGLCWRLVLQFPVLCLALVSQDVRDSPSQILLFTSLRSSSSPSSRLSVWRLNDALRRRPSVKHGEFASRSECFVPCGISFRQSPQSTSTPRSNSHVSM